MRETAADLTSTYVDDALYARLRVDTIEWSAPGRPLDPGEHQSFGGLILAEGWLLDQGRFEDWLDLYADECIYWVPAASSGPATPGGALPTSGADPLPDPQRHVTLAFDDRRRLLDRVHWLRTNLAYSQLPPSRTSHQITGSVIVPTAFPGEVKVRSSLVVHERGRSEQRAVAGWCGHVLTEDASRIIRKVVSLVDSGDAQHNLSFLL